MRHISYVENPIFFAIFVVVTAVSLDTVHVSRSLFAWQTIFNDVYCFIVGYLGTIFVIVGGPKMNIGV